MANCYRLLTFCICLTCFSSAYAQTVPFPEYTDYEELEPWGHSNIHTNWDTSPYLPFRYHSTGMRIMPPNAVTYNASDNSWNNANPGEKYPMMLYFHGAGRKGTDNNSQLKNGALPIMQAIQSGEYNGFSVFPQSANPERAKEIIDKIISEGIPVDPNRIYIMGNSLGATRTWEFAARYPDVVAATWAMSGTSLSAWDDSLRHLTYTRMRMSQGGRDKNPTPSAAFQLQGKFDDLGADMEMIYLPNAGHGTWNQAYAMDDFISWFLDNSVNRIRAKFDYYQVCPEDPVEVYLGVNPFHDDYEWRKDGVLIAGADENELFVTEFADYTVRVKIRGEWTEWSEPFAVSERFPTQTPDIEVDGLYSYVLPDPNGATSVRLTIPGEYETYSWYNEGDDAIGTDPIASEQTFVAATGSYTARALERFGCSSLLSPTFTVIANTGIDVPIAPTDVDPESISKTQIDITWVDQADNEMKVELYRRKSIEEPYQLVALLDENVISYSDLGLLSGQEYFYSLRYINENGASDLSEEVSAITDSDTNPPTAPLDLSILEYNHHSVTLQWDEATDDVGVVRYDVYQDGVKVLTSGESPATVYNLTEGEVYRFTVAAVDLAGNISAMSNRVIASASRYGLTYKYYEGTWDVLPDFNALSPLKIGTTPNVDINVRDQNDTFGILWEGIINIQVAGAYTFETYSDDGSKLYIGGYDEANLVVDNDGTHGLQYREGTYVFPEAGSYPITITYFEKWSGQNMSVYWKNTAHGVTSREKIPDEAFIDNQIVPDESVNPPGAFSAVGKSDTEIDLTWTDRSFNEVNYQLFRSANEPIDFEPIAWLEPNTLTYTDYGLEPETEYFYKISALAQYAESLPGFSSLPIHYLPLDSSLMDFSDNTIQSNESGTIAFDDIQKVQGTHSLAINGTGVIELDLGNQYVHGGFSQRAVAFWVYANSTAGIQDLFDEGGNYNGLAVRINNGNLEFGMAQANDRTSISYAMPAGKWVHVAVTFNEGQVKIYLDGLAVAIGNVASSYTGNHGNNGALGGTISNNAFNSVNNNFIGYIDDFIVFNGEFKESDVQKLVQEKVVEYMTRATTLTAPLDTDPLQNFAVELQEDETALLTWDIKDLNGYEVFRSVGDDTNFSLLVDINDEDLGEHIDADINPHLAYYYKVRAKFDGGVSDFSDTMMVQLPNKLPAFVSNLEDQARHYTDGTSIALSASDEDGDIVSFSANNLPAFVTLVDNNDNTASLEFAMGVDDVGLYENIEIVLNDGFGGEVMESFALDVIGNYAPNIVPSTNDTVSIVVGNTYRLEFAVSDFENDNVGWTLNNIPNAFATVVSSTHEELIIDFEPTDITHGGVYDMEFIASDDNALGSKSSTVYIRLKVIPIDPNFKVYVNFGRTTLAEGDQGGLWFNTLNSVNANAQLENMINGLGIPTDVDLTLVDRWTGSSWGNGMLSDLDDYPDAVTKSFFYVQNTSKSLRLSGLDPNSSYSIDLLPSRDGSGNRTTIVEVGGQSGTLNASFNDSELISFTGLSANASGELLITVSDGDGAEYGYMNALVIEAISPEPVIPLQPTDLELAQEADDITLKWRDNSDNEDGFEVYRSEGDNSNYSLIATVTDTFYVDAGFPLNDLHYQVRAIRGTEVSPYSNEVEFIYSNRAPLINGAEDVTMVAAETRQLVINLVDPEGDDFTFDVFNVPDFVTNTTVGNTVTLDFEPIALDIGEYAMRIEAEDELGNESFFDLDISIIERRKDSVWVNLGRQTNIAAPSPWNNFLVNPVANTTSESLLTVGGEDIGMTLTVVDRWAITNTNGASTGDNSGVYLDDIISNVWMDASSSDSELTLNGLELGKVYDLTFFGSIITGEQRITTFTAGGQTEELVVSNNSQNTVTIRGVRPDAGGQISFGVGKTKGSLKHFNAMVINYYDELLYPATPTDLRAQATSGETIHLNWTDNSDNEDSFEIYASDVSENGPWALVTTTAPNVQSFDHTGLVQNQGYYYYVKAINSASPSLNSNVAKASPFAYAVYLNIGGEGEVASAPWNNTNALPAVGDVYSNLFNSLGENTGIQMEILYSDTPFDGVGTSGEQTGDDSGVFIDEVMRSYWWFGPSYDVYIKFSNLPLHQKFDFEFFASRQNPNNGITPLGSSIFNIGDQSVGLEFLYNTQNTVFIQEVLPDESGEIEVYITTSENVNWAAYFNAVVIRAADVDPCAGLCATLPVELESFGHDNLEDQVVLNWRTLSETDNEGFEVEYSRDGYHFENLGFIAGNGSISESVDYSFQLPFVLSNVGYFRLKQLDYDGNYEYSKVIKVVPELLDYPLEAYPTVVSDYIHLSGGIPDELFRVMIVNYEGKTISALMRPSDLESIEQWLVNQLPTIPSGVHMLSLIGLDGDRHMLKFVKM